MKELCDGEMFLVKGSGVKPYEVKNTGGVYSCSCPAWRNQSVAIERRTCKHLRKLRGDAAEQTRIGGDLLQPSAKAKIGEESEGNYGPPVLLAGSWDSTMDLSGWWLSEKLDGVRAYWDGRRFLSRLGNVYHAPSWFTKNLPATPLDGELWVDRKQFQKTVSIVRRQDQSDQWKEVSYLVFDAPAGRGSFEERMDTLRGLLAGIPDRHVRMVEQNLCRGVAHLREELARIVALGGEGVMARQPGSVYEAGRSATLLKVKQFQDAEAVVIGHEAGSAQRSSRFSAGSTTRRNRFFRRNRAIRCRAGDAAADRFGDYIPIPRIIGSWCATLSLVFAGEFRCGGREGRCSCKARAEPCWFPSKTLQEQPVDSGFQDRFRGKNGSLFRI